MRQIAIQGPSAHLHGIDHLRHQLLQAEGVVTYSDLGAGSQARGPGTVTRNIRDLARRSSRTSREGLLLHQIVRSLQPGIALELGTHLGIGSLYQASGSPACRFITIEGAKELGELARQHWALSAIGLQPELHIGAFDEVLPRLLSSGIRPDYALIDGNHQYEPTLRYFDWIFTEMDPGGIIILDDIYWSQGMKKAWDAIRRKTGISLAIDMYPFGIIQKGPGQCTSWTL